MDYMLFEWINRIGWILRLLAGLGVGIIALVVAFRLTKARICREAAWLLAMGWLASWSISVLHGLVETFGMSVFGWTVMRWASWGLDLLDLGCFLLIAVGLFMFRAPRGGSHG